MNYNYGSYQNQPSYIPSQSSSPPTGGIAEYSAYFDNQNQNTTYSEDILNKNIGKYVKVYMSFADSIEWRDRVFEGILEAWGKDFMLINDKQNKKWYMVWNIYIDYLEFLEPVTY